MVFDLSQINGINDYQEHTEKSRKLYKTHDKAFLVINKNTIEVRCDNKLAKLLREKYESVMKSRYFGSNGIEIVLSNQLSHDDLVDLVRLSYELTK